MPNYKFTLTGEIQTVFFYNRALTDAEIVVLARELKARNSRRRRFANFFRRLFGRAQIW